MNMTSTILSIILVLLGSISLFLSFWCLQKRTIPGTFELSLFMLSVAIYTFGYGLEISHTDLQGVLLAIKFEYTGIPYMSPFIVLFTYKFVSGKSLSKILTIIMFIIPVVSTLLIYTVESHNLFYINPQIIEGQFFPILSFELGPFYIIRVLYQQVISFISIIYIFIKQFNEDKYKRAQLWALLTAQVIPTITFILYLWDLIPVDIDINPFSSFVVSTIFTIAILKFRLFEIIPHGREVALESIDEGFILIDRQGIVQDLNNSAKGLKFIALEIGKKLPKNNEFTNHINTALNKKAKSFDFNYFSDEMTYYKINIYSLKSTFKKNQGIAILINNLTDIMVLMEKLEYKATYDYLTNLRNRRFIIESAIRELEISRRNGNPITFLMVDIDNFKKLNDTYGHQAGDEVLVEVSKVLEHGLRSADIIGRYGGEEFLIVCPDTSKTEGIIIAERLRQNVSEIIIKHNNSELKITCSFGLHTHEDKVEKTNIDKLILEADICLYDAKNSGRNKVCYKE